MGSVPILTVCLSVTQAHVVAKSSALSKRTPLPLLFVVVVVARHVAQYQHLISTHLADKADRECDGTSLESTGVLPAGCNRQLRIENQQTAIPLFLTHGSQCGEGVRERLLTVLRSPLPHV